MSLQNQTEQGAKPRTGLMREAVHGQLREEILRCVLKPGAELREQELAQRFNVSKSPVRDALQRLEREGLVMVVPRQGYRVATISLSDAKDAFELRRLYEETNVALAIKRASDEALADLDRFRHFDNAGHEFAFTQYNSDFHGALADCSGNARLAAETKTLIDHMDRLVYLSVSSLHDPAPQVLVDEHSSIIDMVQNRDVRRAQKLIRNHIAAAEKRVLKALNNGLISP